MTVAAYLERICGVRVGLPLVQLARGPGCSSCTPQQQRHNAAVDARKGLFLFSGDTQISCWLLYMGCRLPRQRFVPGC